MAITGAWKDRKALQSGSLRQGTGWHAIHAQRAGQGRGTAPDAPDTAIDESVVGDYGTDDLALSDEDAAEALYGYGTGTGTADRARYGEEENRSATTPAFPAWGPRLRNGRPRGEHVRSLDHGAENSTASKTDYVTGPQAAGWQNKVHNASPEDAVTSDPSQYEMQTSMKQRDQVRAGSQASGSASQYEAPIASRIPGERLRVFSGGIRHYMMTPREQTFRIRAYWRRNAGTADPRSLLPNSMVVRTPAQRVPPPDPYQGTMLQGTPAGYMEEDTIPYA